ncbi:MAG: ribose 5-phosphate isomerase B [Bacteroidales bacterium]|nr:ribose 5-phosphate isomerase B [Bacteroidales bacterium]
MAAAQKVIPIGSDHAGFQLKFFLIKTLEKEGFTFKDFGTFSEESVDYPDFVHQVAFAINRGEFEKGIIICGSGQGANMTANKYPEVRSALCWSIEQARLSRLHNNANIIALPGRFIDFAEAAEAVKVFFSTDFEGGRHEQRVNKISRLIH